MRIRTCTGLLLLAARLGAVEIPSGTELRIRLLDAVSTASSKPNQPLKAVLIAPVLQDGNIALPAGAELTGVVKTAKAATQANERAALELNFAELRSGQERDKLSARVASVDNARETVDENGKILGIAAGETMAARIDQGIHKVAGRYAGLAELLQATKDAAGVKEAEGDISYAPGAEMTLKLTQPLKIKNTPEGASAALQPFGSESEVIRMVAAQPFRTVAAANPPKPSDIANILFIGTEQQLEKAFAAAGWSTAAALTRESKMETARAVIEDRGYKEAPVSVLLLDGNPPDLVYQKQNNTFAQRHHLRIWRRPGDFDGLPIWVCSATHDTGIDFSPKERTFIHKIDSAIDNEREKVVNDLLFTHMVKSVTLVEREQVPKNAQNATGDSLATDGRMAVVLLE